MNENLIMVVDDSPTVVKFVSFALRSSGCKVVTACDGMDAIEKMSSLEKEVDLIITDLNMPNVDGYELIKTVRENPAYTNVPIIILSSEEEEKDKKLGTKVGASSYLVKPFKPPVLMAEVSKYLKTKQPAI
ncbi:MAG: response regulator [candidate division Zixibacteria bacterium]|nr:response regulator [candidate division Zixibacteria bacterium]